MASSFTVVPVGRVRCTRSHAADDHWLSERSEIELDASRFTPEALAGLEQFSHLQVIYLFDQVDEGDVELTARHPRKNPDWPRVGIFAQRAKRRPNRLGLSTCRLLAVEGLSIKLEGLDAIDGTPVLDLKPWVEEFGPRGQTSQPPWMTELMKQYF